MERFVESTLVPILYLISAVLFYYGIKLLTRVRTARRGNAVAAFAMLLAILGTLLELGSIDYRWIVLGGILGSAVGVVAAYRVQMTEMPEMVALLNGFGGGASMLVAISVLWVDVIEHGKSGPLSALIGGAPALTTALSVLVGAVTLSGSVVAYLKLNGKISGQPILLPGRHAVNLLLLLASLGMGVGFAFFSVSPESTGWLCLAVAAVSLILGVLLVIPIGGADMPVVISLLNSYSGIAGATTGFILGNNVLIISGALVGASGIILTKIMCDAMNRSLANVLFGGFGGEVAAAAGGGSEYKNVRSIGAEEAVLVLESAETVVVVPGYGLAVAQAQHIVREMADLLQKRGARVTYAIHPVAGRMPGHMNVLLAEADVPYEQLIEMDAANPELKSTDVVLVVGANDVVNPAAQSTPGSPIYGMPVLEVWHAGTVMVMKRSLGSGFAGIKNELFERDNTVMLFGDAKKVLQELVAELAHSSAAA
jgi:NAD(P) transhydrogenase subunit beta